MLRDYRKAGGKKNNNKDRGREGEIERRGTISVPQPQPTPHSSHWAFLSITRFLVLSLRNGLMSVYRAWMYQGWLTKWTPPKRAGKLSWGEKRNTHTHTRMSTLSRSARAPAPQVPKGPVPSLWSTSSWREGQETHWLPSCWGFLYSPSLLPSPLTPQLKDDRA